MMDKEIARILLHYLKRKRIRYESKCALAGYSKHEVLQQEKIDNHYCAVIADLDPSLDTSYNNPILTEKEIEKIVKTRMEGLE